MSEGGGVIHNRRQWNLDEGVGDLEGLLAAVRLTDEKLLRVHTEPRRVMRVQRVFRVDERRRAACRDRQSPTCVRTHRKRKSARKIPQKSQYS